MTSKNTILPLVRPRRLDAAQFYAQTFPDSAVGRILRARRLSFRQGGRRDHGRIHRHGHSLRGVERRLGVQAHGSLFFQVSTEDQAETDRLWNAIVGNGGQESQCGWCKDKWGLSWQITPRVLMEAIADPDPAAAKRAAFRSDDDHRARSISPRSRRQDG